MVRNGLVRQQVDLLGYEVEDKVTGFRGIVESVGFDLYGCIQVILRARVDEKGDVKDGRWFDVARLKKIGTAPVMTPPTFTQYDRVHGPAEKPAMR